MKGYLPTVVFKRGLFLIFEKGISSTEVSDLASGSDLFSLMRNRSQNMPILRTLLSQESLLQVPYFELEF